MTPSGLQGALHFGDFLQLQTSQRDPDPVPIDAGARQTALHPLGSVRGVHYGAGDGLAQRPAGRSGRYSARQALAQRARRKLQRQAARRMLESRLISRPS